MLRKNSTSFLFVIALVPRPPTSDHKREVCVNYKMYEKHVFKVENNSAFSKAVNI